MIKNSSLKTICLIFYFATLFISCDKEVAEQEQYLYAQPTSLCFGYNEIMPQFFTVVTNTDYTVEASASWISIQQSGSDWFVKPSINENVSERFDSIVINSNKKREIIYVSQSGRLLDLSVTPSVLSIGHSGNTGKLRIDAKEEWRLIDYPYPNWITCTPDHGYGSQIIDVYCDESAQYNYISHIGVIKFYGEESGKTAQVTIVFNQKNY